MAYSETVGDNAKLLTRSIRGVGDLTGRSRRTDVVYYWIASALVGVVLDFSALTVVSLEASLWFGYGLRLLLLIPMFALFVRRLHDQDRSGWWGLLLPLSVALSIPRVLMIVLGDVEAMIAARLSPVTVASGLVGIMVLALCFWPGTDGPNRYGADPRLEEG
jgi:uncharacterized membrane protein YhaH (DUF805 family)